MSYSWMNPKLEIRAVADGKGIFSKEAVTAGDKMAIFGGDIIAVQEEICDYALRIDEDFVIGKLSRCNNNVEDSDFFNHSCNPNAGIKGQIFLIAMRDIEPDEEVVFDYAMCLHKDHSGVNYRFECTCRSENCRGFVTDEDWRIQELQNKYDGFFSWYLQEKIDHLKREE